MQKHAAGMGGIKSNPVEGMVMSVKTKGSVKTASIGRTTTVPTGDAVPAIEKTPGICGGEARISGTRIPVWVLEQACRIGASEEQLLGAYPTLRRADLAHAWSYVKNNPSEIERDIAENEEA